MHDYPDTSTTWICPTEFDRERMLDMEERLQAARAVMFGALGVGSAIAVPWLGWVPVLLVLAQVVVYAALKPVIARSPRPELPIAFVVVLAQIQIAAAVALTGAAESSMLLVFLLGIVGLPARFSATRVLVAGLVLTEVLIFASTAGVDPSGFAAQPATVIVTAAASFGLLAFARALMQAESQKRSESVVDLLTGLPNRRGLAARVEPVVAEVQRAGTALAVLVCDIDLFKSVNDRHGHQRGDLVLVETGVAIRGSLRPTEQVYRVGGEEFLVLLPGCDLEQAGRVAERIRAAIEAAEPGGLPVTASVGLAAATGADINFDQLSQQADAALYEAKRAGRNRISQPPALEAA